jgi:putative PIN family toxin of toxin-antitoxin system
MLFLQAAVRPSRIYRSLQAVDEGLVSLCISRDLLVEVRDVLTRPELRDRFPALTTDAVDAFVADMVRKATFFNIVPAAFTWPEHADDDHIFNLAIGSSAKYLVTWETRILRLATDQTEPALSLRRIAPQLRIVNPQQLAQILYPSA